MTPALSPIVVSLSEKAATDNGFDRALEREGDWLPFASTLCPLRLWLGARIAGEFVAALSQHNVLHALGEHGSLVTVALPVGIAGARAVPDVPALHRLLRRAFQLSKALPDELLHTFQKRITALPATTEAERLVIQRIGQDVFRDGLLDLWEGHCAVTALTVPELLRASHIKPWADCETDAERLDVYNGILLAPHLDVAFDRGIVTFDDAGVLIVSDSTMSPVLSLASTRRFACGKSKWNIDDICRGIANGCSGPQRCSEWNGGQPTPTHALADNVPAS